MKLFNLISLKQSCSICLLTFLFIFGTGCTKENVLIAPESELLEVESRNPVIHRVSVGGADLCDALGLPTGCDANFSLSAKMHADGSVSGQWQDSFRNASGYHIKVDCLIIDGNTAIVGGVITKGMLNGVDVRGQRAATKVVDNGTSQQEPFDLISFSFNFEEEEVSCELLVEFGFNFPLFPLVHGQVTVN